MRIDYKSIIYCKILKNLHLLWSKVFPKENCVLLLLLVTLKSTTALKKYPYVEAVARSFSLIYEFIFSV